jgi:type ISP restriction-modification system protein
VQGVNHNRGIDGSVIDTDRAALAARMKTYIGAKKFYAAAANVPELVWTYQLGGYPVLKKWLSYQQADRRDGKPLTDDERRWFRQVIQRIAALLALGPSLDALSGRRRECVYG